MTIARNGLVSLVLLPLPVFYIKGCWESVFLLLHLMTASRCQWVYLGVLSQLSIKALT